MEEMKHEIKDEEIPRHSMCFEGMRLKQFRGKDGQLMAMAVPASTPYSREEKEIEKEMKNFIYADEIHHPDHYTWKGVECKDVIEPWLPGSPASKLTTWATSSSIYTDTPKRARWRRTLPKRRSTWNS